MKWQSLKKKKTLEYRKRKSYSFLWNQVQKHADKLQNADGHTYASSKSTTSTFFRTINVKSVRTIQEDGGAFFPRATQLTF